MTGLASHRVPLPVTPEITKRLESRLQDTDDGCRLWTGAVTPRGYGRMRLIVDGVPRTVYPHRYMATVAYGAIPPTMHVDHLCRNTSCCEPTHLEIVSPRLNSVVRAEGRNATTTHCRRGHRYDPSNTATDIRPGYRTCIACRDIRKAER